MDDWLNSDDRDTFRVLSEAGKDDEAQEHAELEVEDGINNVNP